MSIIPGRYLGIIDVLGSYTDLAEEYSIEMRPNGAYVLYMRNDPEEEFVPMNEGGDGRSLAEYCQCHGLDCEVMYSEINRVNKMLADQFIEFMDERLSMA
ncbi:MAG: hypothetical protein R6W92_01995 [Desulfocurvibacter africanus]